MTTDDVTVSGTGEAADLARQLREAARTADTWPFEARLLVRAASVLEAHSQAFAQGAEAMRERAALYFDRLAADFGTEAEHRTLPDGSHAFRDSSWARGDEEECARHAEAIRALDLPPPPSSPEPQKGAGKGEPG